MLAPCPRALRLQTITRVWAAPAARPSIQRIGYHLKGHTRTRTPCTAAQGDEKTRHPDRGHHGTLGDGVAATDARVTCFGRALMPLASYNRFVRHHLHVEDQAWTPRRSQKGQLHRISASTVPYSPFWARKALERRPTSLGTSTWTSQSHKPGTIPRGWSGARTPSHPNGEECQPPPSCLALEIGGGSGGGGGEERGVSHVVLIRHGNPTLAKKKHQIKTALFFASPPSGIPSALP